MNDTYLCNMRFLRFGPPTQHLDKHIAIKSTKRTNQEEDRIPPPRQATWSDEDSCFTFVGKDICFEEQQQPQDRVEEEEAESLLLLGEEQSTLDLNSRQQTAKSKHLLLVRQFSSMTNDTGIVDSRQVNKTVEIQQQSADAPFLFLQRPTKPAVRHCTCTATIHGQYNDTYSDRPSTASDVRVAAKTLTKGALIESPGPSYCCVLLKVPK